MSDVNTNVNDVGERGLSKLEAFLCSACPSDYETENLLLSIQENGVFSLFVWFVLFLFFCFWEGQGLLPLSICNLMAE